jgi:hypothetical protein
MRDLVSNGSLGRGATDAKLLQHHKTVDGKTLAQWLVWAEATVATLDLTLEGPESLFSIIGSVK